MEKELDIYGPHPETFEPMKGFKIKIRELPKCKAEDLIKKMLAKEKRDE